MNHASFNGIFKATLSQTARFSLLGAPYDASSSYRPGARLGPEAIRRLAGSLNACTERGLDLSDLNALDLGDLPLNNRVKQAFGAIHTAVDEQIARGTVPIVLGGDHSVTIPAFEAALRHHPNLHLVYFDAHPDLYDAFENDPFSHACVVRRILEMERMDGSRITQVGIRASTPPQRAVAQEAGIHSVPAWEVARFSFAAQTPVYVSFDVDVLDPAFAPGCGNPVPGGLSTRQVLEALQRVQAPIVGLDIVEVNPLLDAQGITALAAACVVIESLGAMAKNDT